MRPSAWGQRGIAGSPQRASMRPISSGETIGIEKEGAAAPPVGIGGSSTIDFAPADGRGRSSRTSASEGVADAPGGQMLLEIGIANARAAAGLEPVGHR